VGRCAEDGALVFLQHLEPMSEIGGVIVPDLRRYAEVRAKEGRAKFRHKFLPGVTLIAKPLR